MNDMILVCIILAYFVAGCVLSYLIGRKAANKNTKNQKTQTKEPSDCQAFFVVKKYILFISKKNGGNEDEILVLDN